MGPSWTIAKNSRHDDSCDYAHVHDHDEHVHVTSASCLTGWLFQICAMGAAHTRTAINYISRHVWTQTRVLRRDELQFQPSIGRLATRAWAITVLRL